MNWFSGTIPEGISLARSKDGIFVVYIYDQSEQTNTMEEKLRLEEVSKLLTSVSFVAIRFENKSPEATQFSQIYPLVIVPSIFFIRATTGLPIEIIGADIDNTVLIEKIKKIHDDLKRDTSKECASSSTPIDTTPEPVECSNVTVDQVNTGDNEENSSNGVDAAKDASSSSSSQKETVPVEDKVERAQVLIREKQRLKELEGIEDEKKKEVERRTIGQNMEKMQRKKNEGEMSQLALERKRDKDEERNARDRVKAQIAADKADKEARAAILRGEEPVKPVSQELPADRNQPADNLTRIKFRFLDNSSSLGKFTNDALLSELVQHVRTTSNLQHFSLSSVLHQRKFMEADMSQSLSELGLSPSAILLVTPRTSSSPNNIVPKSWSPMDILWMLLSPITSIFHYVGSIFGLTGQSNPKRGEGSSTGSGAQDQAKRPRLDRGGVRNRNPLRVDGNIHRLNEVRDSDDENNTWNGNSTEQM